MGRAGNITGPYRDQEGKDMLHGGGTKLLGTEDVFIGPGHPGIWQEDGQYWFSFHFYNGAQRGQSTYAMRKMKWATDGWPVVETAADLSVAQPGASK